MLRWLACLLFFAVLLPPAGICTCATAPAVEGADCCGCRHGDEGTQDGEQAPKPFHAPTCRCLDTLDRPTPPTDVPPPLDAGFAALPPASAPAPAGNGPPPPALRLGEPPGAPCPLYLMLRGLLI